MVKDKQKYWYSYWEIAPWSPVTDKDHPDCVIIIKSKLVTMDHFKSDKKRSTKCFTNG
jgi:hypothetical protein